MITPASNLRRQRPSTAGTLFRWLLGLFLLVTLGWFIYVYQQIDDVANRDEAQQADAIAVFGAAEYSGRPSPTLHFRLDHAVDLYRKQIAPLVITLGGGSDKDSGNTEGGVGRDYLLANGIPFGNIIAETRSVDTEQQVHRLAAIARENNLHHIVVVSDGTHLFRIRELCRDAGLDVYTSPRATIGHISNYDRAMRYFHEILSYTFWRLGINVSWLHRWLEGREDI
ncbi:MAG TPA: YdcF family protein [Edaphobacter sp.]